MLNKALIPTPLLRPGQAHPVEVRVEAAQRWRRAPQITLHLTRWLLRLIWKRARKQRLDLSMAREIRAIIEEMGGLWVKTGQLLSLRTDVLTPDFSRELSRLQYAARGFPFEVAKRAIEAGLGRPLMEVFDEFDQHPIAAASICQVHRAKLRREQEWVAVKVQRPGIAATFTRDLSILRILMGGLQRMPSTSFFTWDEMIWETEQIFLEEVDYRYEAANMRRLKKSLREHKIYVPKVYECISQSVLVMEWVPGVLMSNFLDSERNDPEGCKGWCAENNVDPRRLGEKLFLTFFRQLFEDNLFHGDLHPGNIMLLRDNRLALIDLGSAGSVDATLLHYYKLSMKAVGEKDFPMAVDYLFLLSERLPPIDTETVKARVVEAYQAWSERAEQPELPYYEKSIGNMGLEAGNALIENKVVLSWSFMKISRTWATLDASLSALLPEVNYMKLVAKYFRGAQRRARRSWRRAALDAAHVVQEFALDAEMRFDTRYEKQFRFARRNTKLEDVLRSVMSGLLGLVLVLAALGLLMKVGQHSQWIGQATEIRRIEELVPEAVRNHRTIALLLLLFSAYQIQRLKKRLQPRETKA
jgi:ubiquinone biosynthesis protein